MKLDAPNMFWLFNETVTRLNSLQRLVDEAKSLEEAANFSKFVLNSRLCDFLDEHASASVLPCDGKVVREKATRLLKDVQLRWEFRDDKPHVQQSELEQIHAELSDLRKIVTGASEPRLRVIKGGSRGA